MTLQHLIWTGSPADGPNSAEWGFIE